MPVWPPMLNKIPLSFFTFFAKRELTVDGVHGSHGLALGVLGVGDGIADHVLKEGLDKRHRSVRSS